MQNKTILLINGSYVLMDITKKILEREGYVVYCAVGSAEAKRMLAENPPDGVVIEAELPDKSGFDYCRELRAESAVPIMIVSKNKDDELFSLKAGASDYLKKPFNYEVLKARLDVMIDTQGGSMEKTEKPEKTEKAEITEKSEKTETKAKTEPVRIRKANFGVLYMAAAVCLIFILSRLVPLNTTTVNPNRSETGEIGERQEVTEIFENIEDTSEKEMGNGSEGEMSEGEVGEIGEIGEEEVPLGVLDMFIGQDANAVPYTKDSAATSERPEYLVPHYDVVTVFSDTGKAEMVLLNPGENLYDFKFEIVLESSGESLYKSGIVEPGMCIEGFTLKNPPEKGEHKAFIIIGAYEKITRIETAGDHIDFIISVV